MNVDVLIYVNNLKDFFKKDEQAFKDMFGALDIDKELDKIQNIINKLKVNKFERCFEAEDETFRGKRTGNKILSKNCSFCEFRFECWSTLKEKPSVMSQAKERKLVPYVYLEKEYA